MTCGTVFKEDSISVNIIEFYEDDIFTRAKELLKKGTFTKYEPEKLAISIIKEIRLKYNMQGWNQQL